MIIPQILSPITQRTCEFISLLTGIKYKFHHCLIFFFRQFAAHHAHIPPQSAAGFTIKCITDSVQNRRFPGARLTADQKEPTLFECLKINKLFFHIRTKTAKSKRYRSHDNSPSFSHHSSTSLKSESCSSFGRAPPFSPQNLIMISTSSSD